MHSLNARTELFCLFGNPAKHSLSPVMHNAAFIHEKINAVYLAFELESIEKAITAMRTLPISGASVTTPFKTDVQMYIDEIDETARRIGAINTIKNNNGKLTGYNTDGYGACAALEDSIGSLEGKNVLVIGSGGASRAIAFSLLERKANLTIASRMGESQLSLVAALREYYTLTSLDISTLSAEVCENYDVIMNTSPLGMKDGDSLPIPAAFILPKHAVFDLVYHPIHTPFLISAKERKATCITGVEMLVHQGTQQFEIWTGKKAPYDIMKKAVSAYLS